MSSIEEKARDSADFCLACTSCVANCPVTAAEQQYRGPKLVGPAHYRMHFSETDEERSLDFCSNCKNCDITCPSGVSVSTLNMLERGKYYRTHAHSQRDYMLAHSSKVADLARKFPLGTCMANLGMEIGSALGVLGMMGIATQHRLPKYAGRTFLEQFKSFHQVDYPKKVVFFPGCYINQNEPEVGMAFVKVMQQNHYEVLIDEEFVCCGSPMVAIGYLDEAEKHAEINTARILEWKAKGYPVVACCTSCSLMLKQEYAELFAQEDMQAAGSNVYDAFEFLAESAENGHFNEDFCSIEEKLIYHAPCHLRAQGIGLPALDLLRRIPGLEIENADAGCCGISGNYGFKKEKYEVSMKVGEKLFNRLKESGAPRVVCDCGTCRMQIVHATKMPVCHPIQLLAEAYRK